ncbi:chemotaxis protein CheA [Parvularcula sp. LCG005]|nr:chemotaxis protein CheA [Parvularcula sp. LCG005]WOI52616.1 chemotaxis protein CheA [Parvularcula sp. LCG005]
MAEIRQTFFIECDELLEALEADLIRMSEGDYDSETVNSVFRAVHSIKGGAGAFALEDLVRFAHKFETTLDEVRAGRLEPSDEVLAVFLRANDVLADVVHAARDDTQADTASIDTLIADLASLVGGTVEPAAKPAAPAAAADDGSPDEFGFQPVTLSFDMPEEGPGPKTYTIGFAPTTRLYQTGNESAFLIRGLADIGHCTTVCDTSSLPSLDEMDPEAAYFSWTITLESEDDIDAVRDVFDFVTDACALSVEELTATDAAPDPQADEFGFAPVPLAFDTPIEETADDEAPAPASLAAALLPAAEAPGGGDKDSQAKKAEPSGPKATVRVDLDRVDRLINLVGELVINQAMLAQCATEEGVAVHSNFATGLDEFKQLTREIQESVMAIRAQPVKPLFQRMSRIVREAAGATGKSVRLKVEGEGTEVDKTVVERLSDPLTHMIRNAVDHGLEKTEDREASGKSSEGTVRLSAAHRSGRVVIEVADDGGGINRARVKEKAIEKGLISPDAELSNSEIDALLFAPGFSTANAVSDLSGRGVGMDVVKRAIQALGGRISITSEPKEGTTFSISLPLTLAVLDGMVVKAADQTLVMPLTAIVETLKARPSDIHEIHGGQYVVFVRDKFVPIVDVAYFMGFRDALPDYSSAVILLIEGDDGTMSALAVDDIVDQRQVVIKGLEENYGHVQGVAAATILGDGRIALILDPDALHSATTPTSQLIQPLMTMTGTANV